jgi:hypothetical protein
VKTNKFCGKLLAAFLALSLMLPAPAVLAQVASLCTGKGYTIGFFNGVWNMPDDAANGMEALAALQGDTFEGKPITYDTFYNTTGSAAGSSGSRMCSRCSSSVPARSTRAANSPSTPNCSGRP